MTLNEWLHGMQEEVLWQYIFARRSKMNRTEAITKIEELYKEELSDSDDAVIILVALSMALMKKKELTEVVRTRTLREINKVTSDSNCNEGYKHCLLEFANRMRDDVFLGAEAKYRKKNTYIPDWQNGDLFIHTIQDPTTKQYGVYNWTILLYKVAEYWHDSESLYHLMYAAICPSDKIPQTREERQAIRWLRMMRAGDKWDYLLQAQVKTKRQEESYELKKIGNFWDIIPPKDRSLENPFVSMVLYGKYGKNEMYPGFESHLSKIYYNENRRNEQKDILSQLVEFWGQGDGSVSSEGTE